MALPAAGHSLAPPTQRGPQSSSPSLQWPPSHTSNGTIHLAAQARNWTPSLTFFPPTRRSSHSLPNPSCLSKCPLDLSSLCPATTRPLLPSPSTDLPLAGSLQDLSTPGMWSPNLGKHAGHREARPLLLPPTSHSARLSHWQFPEYTCPLPPPDLCFCCCLSHKCSSSLRPFLDNSSKTPQIPPNFVPKLGAKQTPLWGPTRLCPPCHSFWLLPHCTVITC